MSETEMDFTTLEHASPILTKEFLSTSLTNWFGRPVQFTHWEYVGGANKGESFLSDLIRIKIYGKDSSDKEEVIQVILKTIPKSKCRQLTYRLDEFFRNEIQFYQKVLPELLKFQEKKNPKEPFDQYTKLFAAYTDGINDIVALEDVSLQGYGSPIRQEGIDYDHCKVVLCSYAKFHALSFALKDQEPENFAKLRTQISETYHKPELWDWYEKFWARICGIAIDAVEKEYPNSIYLEKVKKFATPEAYPRMCEATGNQNNAVISHADSWLNNFLFKYENSSKPLDAKLIDFQLARCASPVLDIVFFIYACTTQELRKDYYHPMLKLYHVELSQQIKDLGTDPEIYSWDMFMADVKKYSFYGMAFTFESVPFIVLDPEDAPNMEMEGEEKININDVWTIGPIKTKRGRLRLAGNIVHCVDNGYI